MLYTVVHFHLTFWQFFLKKKLCSPTSFKHNGPLINKQAEILRTCLKHLKETPCYITAVPLIFPVSTFLPGPEKLGVVVPFGSKKFGICGVCDGYHEAAGTGAAGEAQLWGSEATGTLSRMQQFLSLGGRYA